MDDNKAIIIKRFLLAAGGVITTILGGWDMLLSVLVSFVIVDYVLGIAAAAINEELDSSVGFRGICKKVMLFVPVGVAYALDQALGSQILRNMAIWFYIGNEGISIMENLGKAGVPIPKFIREILVQLRDTSDKGELIK